MKVKLPKNVCEAIETMQTKGLERSRIIANHVVNDHLRVNGWEQVNKLTTETLICACYFGFEPIEEDIQVTITPDQQRDIKTDFDSYDPNLPRDSYKIQYCLGAQQGIRLALTTFNIKIEGVNQ